MHEITLLGDYPGGVSFLSGIDFLAGSLILFRPIIVCTLTGAILGDIQTGLITGGLTELAFAGLTYRWCSAAQPYYGGSDDHCHCMVYGR